MYKVDVMAKRLEPLQEVSYAQLGIKERFDIQEWIEKTPAILGEELLILAKEYELPSRCRLDLLAVDRQGQLVIIELKRDDSGPSVDWQAIKYASYCSAFSNEQIIQIFASYAGLSEAEAEQQLESFIELAENGLHSLNHKQRIILAARQFHSDVVEAVLWLLDYGLEIQCVKIDPYMDTSTNTLFISPTIIIPAPEARDFIKRKETKHKEKSLTRESAFSLEASNLPPDELIAALQSTFESKKRMIPAVQAFLQILLSEPKTFDRQTIMQQLMERGLSDSLTQAGQVLSNISTFLTHKANPHFRQIISFTGGQATGKRKDNYYLRNEYREILKLAVGSDN